MIGKISFALLFVACICQVNCDQNGLPEPTMPAGAMETINYDEVPLANIDPNGQGQPQQPQQRVGGLKHDLKGLFNIVHNGAGRVYQESKPTLNNIHNDLRGIPGNIIKNPRVQAATEYAKPKIQAASEYAKPRIEYAKNKVIPIYEHGKGKLYGLLSKTGQQLSNINSPAQQNSNNPAPVAVAAATPAEIAASDISNLPYEIENVPNSGIARGMRPNPLSRVERSVDQTKNNDLVNFRAAPFVEDSLKF